MNFCKTSARRTSIAAILLLMTSPVLGEALESESSNDFQQALKSKGWDVKQSQDGTLTLRPPQQVNVGDETDVGTEMVSSETSRLPVEALQKRLEAAGWIVSRDTDGSLVFHRPEKIKQNSKQASSEELPAGLDSLLSNPHWRVKKSADGSLLLYPQEPEVDKKFDSAQITQGVSVIAKLKLPVDEWSEANSIARAWLESTGDSSLAIGKIRKILRVYLVSIVQNEAPFALQHQIAIRQSDGNVIVLN